METRPEWLSVRDYCEQYALDRKTVYKYMDCGLLETWQVGRVLRVKNRPPLEAMKRRPARGIA